MFYIPHSERGLDGQIVNKPVLGNMATTSKIESSSSKPIKPSHYYCCVPMCTSDGRYDVGVSFHHIPKDKRGVLDPIDAQQARKLRASLVNKLNR